jgi:hypothetical protein
MRPGKVWALIGPAAILIVAGILWPRESTPLPKANPVSSVPEVQPAPGPRGEAQAPSTRRQIAQEIAAAQDAITQQIGHPPYSSPITQRPDFVSPLEWKIFEGVARTHADPAQELALLVNRLRFARLESLWRSLRNAGSKPELRRVLAQQLLDEIPERVRERQFDRAQAQSLQLELLGDLVSDPVQRVQRASEESLRLSEPAVSR